MAENTSAARRPARNGRGEKSPNAFRTISEVAAELDVAQHVLRFWESKFKQIKPLKRAGGRRFYRPEDVDLLRRIKFLLRDERYTIEGVQRLLDQGRLPELAEMQRDAAVAARTEAGTADAESPGTAAAETDAEEAAAQLPLTGGGTSKYAGAESGEGGLPEATRSRLQSVLSELKAIRQGLAEIPESKSR